MASDPVTPSDPTVEKAAVDLPSPPVEAQPLKRAMTEAEKAELIKSIQQIVKDIADTLEADPNLAVCVMVNGASSKLVTSREQLEMEIIHLYNIVGVLRTRFGAEAKLMLLNVATWPKDPETPLIKIKLNVSEL